MLSRIADSLYWIGRYVERAEDTARLTDIAYHNTLGLGSSPDAAARRQNHWEALIAIAGDPATFRAKYGEASEVTVPPYLTFDTANPNSIVSCVAQAREQSRGLRHQIASEMWEVLNRFHLDLQRQRTWQGTWVGAENAHLFYRNVKEFSHLFQGVTDSTMPREEGWSFLQAGKFLERATKTARALDVKYHLLMEETASASGDGIPLELPQWQALLRSFSAYEPYHKLYRTAVRPRTVVELIVLSAVFPRSIRFAVEQVDESLTRIAVACAFDPDTGPGESVLTLGPFAAGTDEAARLAGRLRSRLTYGTIDEVVAMGVGTFLQDVQQRCHQIGERIHAQYFAPRILHAEEVVA
ncbi:MAG: hypothetical protein QOF73_2670 [Thermomicrobiales bacterium]|jgi:uncharacterized alpha-E superfamily protein|nr:hypothetical protein [Thermomicrobiales bacterium]